MELSSQVKAIAREKGAALVGVASRERLAGTPPSADPDYLLYAVMYDVPNEYLIVPLLCLVCMFFLNRHPTSSSKRGEQRLVMDA